MIKVLIYAPDTLLYVREFVRRFGDKFEYLITRHFVIEWKHMRITIVDEEPRGYRADIAVGFNQDSVNFFTQKSCINIKEKRTTTYFELLDAINDDGSFNWSKYLSKKAIEFYW